MMNSIVISIGGSVILSKEADVSYLKKLSNLLLKIANNYKVFIIVGGGNIARRYIKLGRELAFDEDSLDLIGIDITRVNARILTNLLKDVNKEIPHTTKEALNSKNSIVVMGGTTPGHSTDLVGAELAEKVGAQLFIIATNVDGVYDKDPNKYPDAKQLKNVSIDQLVREHGTDWESAGKNTVIDGPALSIIQQSKIPTVIVNGKRLDQLENAMTNQSFIGTTILM